MFGDYFSDNLPTLGYVNVDELLTLVSEAEIYSMVFGIVPKEGMFVTSPFRNDTNPGCYFKTVSNELKFYDWGNNSVYTTKSGFKIQMGCINCFMAVQVYYQLPTFPATLQFIWNWVTNNKSEKLISPSSSVIEDHIRKLGHTSSETRIYTVPRPFTITDRDYWKQYGISSNNLISDNIESVNKYVIVKDSEARRYFVKPNQKAYQLSNIGPRTKLYFPESKYRFLNTYTVNDIGCFNSLPEKGNLLVISKSYKDCRVLRNFGLNSVWYQNEKVIPTGVQVDNLFDRFKEIVIFYDNDETGIQGAINLKHRYRLYYKNPIKTVRLNKSYLKHNIKDISDLYRYKSPTDVQEFITNKILKR